MLSAGVRKLAAGSLVLATPVLTTLVLATLAASTPADAGAASVRVAPAHAKVVEAQRLLGELGYPIGNLPLGGLGVRTRGAISYFQRKYGLPVTGLPDPWTIAAMRGVVASLRGVTGPAQSQPRDLVERTVGDGIPILTVAVALAVVLALLAVSSHRRRDHDSAKAEDTVPAGSGDR